MIYLGLPWFQKTKWGTLEMPNAHNFGWDMHLFLLIFMSSYVFGIHPLIIVTHKLRAHTLTHSGLPMMMLHMRAQRKSFFLKQKQAAADNAAKKRN